MNYLVFLSQTISMKKIYSILTILISVLLFAGCFGGQANMQSNSNYTKSNVTSTFIDASRSNTQEELLSTVSPAVVGISSISGRQQSIGTGVSISNKSYILTNNHVVDGGNIITLYLYDGTTCSANIVWRDSSYDLAILQADKSIPYLKMADSGSYSAGEDVIAIGTPLALAFKHSATKGIISATNRTIQVDNDYGESTLDNLIQHDASINPGNSGGPLINLKGEVLGINTVKITDAEGMGFAIPVDTIHPLVQNLSADGYYDTAYMGVFGFDANLKQIGNGKTGYYVQSVASKCPAEKLGLNSGDIIISIDGEKIDGSMSLRRILYSHKVGDKVLVKFERNGEIKQEYVTLEKHPCCYKSQRIPLYEN